MAMPEAIAERPLAGRRIAVLEHRELDRLGAMLEAQGAATLRCPLVAIVDARDAAPVVAGELRRHGVEAAIMPQGTYFMKPLVSAIVAALAG